MWPAVRRELARLEWDAAPPLTEDLLSERSQTVPSLVGIRRVLGPVFAHDPLAMLATATIGAARTTGAELTVAPSLLEVRGALAGVARVMEVGSDDDRRRLVATLNHVAYELVHWVRVRATEDRAKAWLLAEETALDSAIHAPADRSAIGVGLAAWQDALAAVQPVQNASIVRRSVTLGGGTWRSCDTPMPWWGKPGNQGPCPSRTATPSSAASVNSPDLTRPH